MGKPSTPQNIEKVAFGRLFYCAKLRKIKINFVEFAPKNTQLTLDKIPKLM
jgi:hypothetical protein